MQVIKLFRVSCLDSDNKIYVKQVCNFNSFKIIYTKLPIVFLILLKDKKQVLCWACVYFHRAQHAPSAALLFNRVSTHLLRSD